MRLLLVGGRALSMMTMHRNQNVRRGILRGRQAGRAAARLAPARTDGRSTLRHLSLLSAITNASVPLPTAFRTFSRIAACQPTTSAGASSVSAESPSASSRCASALRPSGKPARRRADGAAALAFRAAQDLLLNPIESVVVPSRSVSRSRSPRLPPSAADLRRPTSPVSLTVAT
jgi:hypothetical protein